MNITEIDNLRDPEEAIYETWTIGIAGMTCDHCVETIKKALHEMPGMRDVLVDRSDATATVTYDRRKTNIAAVHEQLLKSGYTPSPFPPAEDIEAGGNE